MNIFKIPPKYVIVPSGIVEPAYGTEQVLYSAINQYHSTDVDASKMREVRMPCIMKIA